MIRYPYSQEIARRSRSNFYLSFYFLSRAKRNGILALYAFSRLVDDAVDEARNPEEARQQITLWRRRVHFCFNGTSPLPLQNQEGQTIPHPLLPELLETIRQFRIPEQYLSELLTGVEMDLEKKRYSSFKELETYCYHVAGTIGLLCNQIFGLSEGRAQRYAILLGTAFQLTNILRDIAGDAQRGRIYLPEEDLAYFGVVPSDLLVGKTSPAFYRLMRFQAERARSYYEQAFQTLPWSVRRKIVPAQLMTAFYQRILQKLVDENFPVFQKKIGLTQGEKGGFLTKTLLLSLL